MTESPPDGTLFREVTLTEANRSWNWLIQAVVDTGAPVTLTRYGKPVAVLAPYSPESSETDEGVRRDALVARARHIQAHIRESLDGRVFTSDEIAPLVRPPETAAQAAQRLALTRQRGIELLETLGTRAGNNDPLHPGEILQGEFFSSLGISWQTIAASSGIPIHDIISIVDCRQPVTPDVAAALGRSLGTTAEFWVNLQREYDRRTSNSDE